MSRIIPLSRKRHADLTFRALEDYSFAASMTTMPLLPFEAPEAARCFPVIFPDPRNAVPHALLGLGASNAFVDKKGRWTAPYLPLMAANHPFSLIEARFVNNPDGDAEKGEIALAIEEDAPHFHQKDGLPLYGPDGEPSELLQGIMKAMSDQYRRHRACEQALAELALHGALRERVLGGRRGDGAERRVGGLRCADRAAIMALPEATLGQWVRNGLMEMLFAHWHSLRHLQTLLDDPSCPGPGPEPAPAAADGKRD